MFLAGGVAHDFNNILSSILGNAQMASMPGGGGEEKDNQQEYTVDHGAHVDIHTVVIMLIHKFHDASPVSVAAGSPSAVPASSSSRTAISDASASQSRTSRLSRWLKTNGYYLDVTTRIKKTELL